jgi:hypothetical protein
MALHYLTAGNLHKLPTCIMTQRWKSAPRFSRAFWFNRNHCNSLLGPGIGKDLAPWAYNKAVAVSLPPAFMLSALRRGRYENSIFNGPRLQKQVPVSLARRLGKCRGHGDNICARLG